MQAGIVWGGRVEVDEEELFWVDYGDSKSIPMRIMAAPKEPPRAGERVVVADIHAAQVFMGATSIYWVDSKDGGIYKVAKAGASPQKVLAAAGPVGFARFERDVYAATKEGLFLLTEGGPPKLRYRLSAAPAGLAADAKYLYWIDPERQAIFKLAR